MKAQRRLEIRVNQLASVTEYIGSYDIKHKSWQPAVLKRRNRKEIQ